MLVVGALGAWVAIDVVRVRDHLLAAADDITEIRELTTAGDIDAARTLLPGAQDHAAAAASAAGNPLLGAATRLPAYGDDVAAVRTLSTVVAQLTEGALPGFLDAVTVLGDDGLIRDGRIDVRAIAAASPAVQDGEAALRDAVAVLARIEQDELIEELRGPVAELSDALAEVNAQTVTAAKALRVMPTMLGLHEPRTYLLVTQNNAEARSLGGIPGAFVELTVTDGLIEITGQGDAGSIGSFDDPVLPITEDEGDLLGPLLGMFPQNATFTPHFPRAAEIVGEMWQRSDGTRVDGVLATDPVALGYLLDATGPVDVAGTEVSGENAAELLLNQVYFAIAEPEQQDAFFAAAAGEVFGKLTGGDVPAQGVLRALERAAREDRLLLWSRDEDEQAELQGTVLSGELVGARAEAPVVGVYLNDATASKMTYYLDQTIAVASRSCDAGQQLTTTLRLASHAPDGGVGLPAYVLGDLYDDGAVRTNVLLYAPAGGIVTGVRRDGVAVPAEEWPARLHGGLQAIYLETVLAPGQETTLEVDMTAGAGLTGDPIVRSTPGARPSSTVTAPSACS
ncbi:chemotaxis protein [Flavimobilis marinus]|uniref:DUF4012 domain-containing protein n=1 Tax=Flavimobilis marinus TaxID=285351 RepID=A0A1I2GQP4_9MICO|nr:chemotaxis protein [Flavimobilis marinus]SFF19598.1 Protein of unknown function [Flavimobilis marinus]